MENGPFTDDVPSYKPPCIRNFPWPDLVGGLELFFPYIENFIIPTDFHIFAEGLKPPTSRWYLFPCPKPMWVGITNFRQGFPSGITFGTSACEGGPLPWDEKWDQKVPVRVPWHLTKIAGIYGCSCNYICIYTNIYIYIYIIRIPFMEDPWGPINMFIL